MKKLATSVFYFVGLLCAVAGIYFIYSGTQIPVALLNGAWAPATQNASLVAIYYQMGGSLITTSALLIAAGAVISFLAPDQD